MLGPLPSKGQDGLREVVEAFRRGGGEGKPKAVQVAISYAADEDEALAAAHRHWPIATVDLAKNQDLAMPGEFDRETAGHRPEELKDKLRISSHLRQHLDWLRSDAEIGFDEAYLHHVGPDHRRFIDAFAERILPEPAG